MRKTPLWMACFALLGCSAELAGLAEPTSSTNGDPINTADAGNGPSLPPDPGAPAPVEDAGAKPDASVDEDAAAPPEPPGEDEDASAPPAPPEPEPEDAGAPPPPEPTFILTSSTIAGGGEFPVDHTCDGKDQSPALMWMGAPSGTLSYALVITDLDASGGGGSTGGTSTTGGGTTGASTGGSSGGSSSGSSSSSSGGSSSGSSSGGSSSGGSSGGDSGMPNGNGPGGNSGMTSGNGPGNSGNAGNSGNSGGPGGNGPRGLEAEDASQDAELTQSGLAQWAIWDVGAAYKQLPANVLRGALPANVPGAKQVRGLAPLGLAGGNNYAGPCPGRRVTHNYQFTIYALGVALLPGARTDGKPADIVALLANRGAVLGTATLSASYTGE